jgi:ABC-type transporter Mla subunit MlaD
MRLPVPGPRDVLGLLERGADQLETLLGLVPRMVTLLDRVEGIVERIDATLDQVDTVTGDAAGVVARVDGVVDHAEANVNRLAPLLDGMEPSLTKLQPTLERLAETTHPDEVAALVTMVDHLPELTHRLETDILPIMGSLGTVAPDLHDLLAVSRELNDMLAKVPGLGRIKRRIDEEQGEDETDQKVLD